MKKAKDGTKKPVAGKASRDRAPSKAGSPSRSAPKPARRPEPAKAHAKPVSKTPAKTPAKTTSKPAAKPVTKPATKPVTKPAAKAPAKPVATPAPKTAAKAPRPATSARKPARAAPSTVLTLAPSVQREPERLEAPKKFQREYKKWLERLLSLRRQLVADGERLGEEGLKALEQEVSVDHMADYGSDSYEQDTTLALIENKSEALRDVDEAIRRIEAKTYGLCEECEQQIPSGRLEVLPHARYCVKCQAAREGAA